jgi:trans-L-3-hydroxyproline dehydratase
LTTSGPIKIVDMHTCGEPVRIVEAGYPELVGGTILEKRRDAEGRFDGIRRMIMLEPRGHDGMYGVIPVSPSAEGADLAVLFTHQNGYSSMCGHATIAVGRWAVDSGRVASTDGRASFMLEAPCGLLAVNVEPGTDGISSVSFESVPSFAYLLDAVVNLPEFGAVRFDIGFGGAFFAVLPASRLGLCFFDSPLRDLAAAGTAVTNAVREAMEIRHPTEPELSSLYGTILTDDGALGEAGGKSSFNLCIFGAGQVDRSPTGSGTAARVAIAAARGDMRAGDACEVKGLTGDSFAATLASLDVENGVQICRVRVSGKAFYSGRAEFIAEAGDRFALDFTLPESLAGLRG